jgi:poly(A) polymerase
MSSSSVSIDMSTKLGGRVFHPVFPLVDGNFPTEIELAFDKTLTEYRENNIPLETLDNIRKRERVLDSMKSLCYDWIRSVAQRKGLGGDNIHPGGQLFTSGSYRLGVHEPGADIDTILVAPSLCEKADFFGNEDVLDSLATRISSHPDVTNFVPVENAAVPILTFDWEGINIDLLFARLHSNVVPADFDIDNDIVLDGADSATAMSLNGPRVTNLIAAFASGTPQRYQNFLTLVRCIRKWAKARGLYSNKMGYWGGVNINICAAVVVQLYPNACPAILLRKFFMVLKTWRWPTPIRLCEIHDAGYGLPVWTPHPRQIAPILTPAYPSMNSTLSVSRQTLRIFQDEFDRAYSIIDGLWNQLQTNPKTELDWERLFEPSDFFINYSNYLSLCIVGPTQVDVQVWAGFVESRLRKLVSDLLARFFPMKKIQLWPKKIEACIADKSALLTSSQRQNCVTYFIGFNIDRKRLRGDTLNIEIALQNFRDLDLVRFQPLVPGMDVCVKYFGVKELPKICFESIYGSKLVAMQKRRRILDADPIRRERKIIEAKIAEKKAELEARMTKLKDEKKKRKREQVEMEAEAEAAVAAEMALKQEEFEQLMPHVEEDIEEETDELANVFNTAGESKSRAEAEAEKEKLLAGDDESAREEDYESSNEENAVGYAKDEVRQIILPSRTKQEKTTKWIDKRSLPVPDDVLETLQKLGYNIVDDDHAQILGNNLLPPWKHPNYEYAGSTHGFSPTKVTIRFLEKFDIVELDALGHVIDKGDDDFTPSKTWLGRKAGFEFKLGERGLGYYRTGRPVVVPSNTAY